MLRLISLYVTPAFMKCKISALSPKFLSVETDFNLKSTAGDTGV